MVEKVLESPQHYPILEQDKAGTDAEQDAEGKSGKGNFYVVEGNDKKHFELTHAFVNAHRIAFCNIFKGGVYIIVLQDQSAKGVVMCSRKCPYRYGSGKNEEGIQNLHSCFVTYQWKFVQPESYKAIGFFFFIPVDRLVYPGRQ